MIISAPNTMKANEKPTKVTTETIIPIDEMSSEAKVPTSSKQR